MGGLLTALIEKRLNQDREDHQRRRDQFEILKMATQNPSFDPSKIGAALSLGEDILHGKPSVKSDSKKGELAKIGNLFSTIFKGRSRSVETGKELQSFLKGEGQKPTTYEKTEGHWNIPPREGESPYTPPTTGIREGPFMAPEELSKRLSAMREEENQQTLKFSAQKEEQDDRLKRQAAALNFQQKSAQLHQILISEATENEKQMQIGLLTGTSATEGAWKPTELVPPNGGAPQSVLMNEKFPGRYLTPQGKPIVAPAGWSVGEKKTGAAGESEKLAIDAYKEKHGISGELTAVQKQKAIAEQKQAEESPDAAAQRALTTELARNRVHEVTGGASGGPVIAGPPDAEGHHPEALTGLAPGQQEIVKKLTDYSYPWPGSFALRLPYWQKILETAGKFDPTFSVPAYEARRKLMVDFTSGKASANIRSLNTAVAHLDTLKRSAESLKNRGVQIWNRIANAGLTQIGDPRVTNFNMAATAVEGELATAFKGTSGTNQEITAWRDNLNASESPEQLDGAIDKAVELIDSRINFLKNQYKEGMGKPPKVAFLSPKSQEILSRIKGGGQAGAHSAPGDTIQMKLPDGRVGKIHKSQKEKFVQDHPGSSEVPGA